jgi:hypothetical protein
MDREGLRPFRSDDRPRSDNIDLPIDRSATATYLVAVSKSPLVSIINTLGDTVDVVVSRGGRPVMQLLSFVRFENMAACAAENVHSLAVNSLLRM